MTVSNFNTLPCPKCKGTGEITLYHVVFQCWRCEGSGQKSSAEMEKPTDRKKMLKILLTGLWTAYGITVLKVLGFILAFLWAVIGGRRNKTWDFIEDRINPSDESQLPAQECINIKKSSNGESQLPAQEVINDRINPSDKSQLSTGLGARQILSPRIKAAFAVSAIFGATASTFVSYFIIENEIFWGEYWSSFGIFFVGLGVVISILTNYSVLAIALDINKHMDERFAFRVGLIGIIPGVLAAAVGALFFWGILL